MGLEVTFLGAMQGFFNGSLARAMVTEVCEDGVLLMCQCLIREKNPDLDMVDAIGRVTKCSER